MVYFVVSVASIKEVRGGKTTEALKNKEIAGIYQDECAFSIIFGDDFDSMDLIANTPDEANIWLTGLTCLINTNTKTRTCMYTQFSSVYFICFSTKPETSSQHHGYTT